MTITFEQALGLNGVDIPDHIAADAEVPILTVPQGQGDLLIVPASREFKAGKVVPDAGVQVVHGEATGNTHWLHGSSTKVRWARLDFGQTVGLVDVPEGETAYLIHTDEHGSNAMGPGVYELRRKREQAEEIRLVAD